MAVTSGTLVTLEWTGIVMDSANVLLHIRIGLEGGITSRTDKLLGGGWSPLRSVGRLPLFIRRR